MLYDEHLALAEFFCAEMFTKMKILWRQGLPGFWQSQNKCMCLVQKLLRAARHSRMLRRNLPKVYYILAENIQSIPRASASHEHQHLWCQDQWLSCNSRSYWQTFCHSRQHKLVVLQRSQISALTGTHHRRNSRGDQDANSVPWLGSTLQHRSATKRPKQLPDEAYYVSQSNKK